MYKKLYRSREDKVVSGVCGGLAEYFEIDPTFIRILWAISIFIGGTGLFAYILFVIIIPEKPRLNVENEFSEVVMEDKNEFEEMKPKKSGYNQNNTNFIGYAFIGVGILLVLNKLNWFDMEFFWPLALILLGAFLLFKRR
jgi:phage shock protein C